MSSKKSNKLIKKLKEEKKRGDNPRFFDFLQKLFGIQAEIEKKIGKIKPGLKKEDIKQRQESGMPLIGYADLILDWPLLNETFTGISALFTEYSDLFGGIPDSEKMADSQQQLSGEIVRTWFNEDKLSADTVTEHTDEYLLLDTLIQATMKPFLVSHARALIDSVKQEEWRRLRCPICGGKPDIAYLDKARGSRWLVCSRCDTEWVYQRPQCPYCGTEEQKDLAYFTDDEGIYRLYTCERCHTYLKTIDSRKVKTEVLMPLERVLTLDMDRQAQEKGYKPGHIEDLTDFTGSPEPVQMPGPVSCSSAGE